MPDVRRLDLGKARILVTNDDGIQAPGLEVLERVARSVSDDVWVVAPEQEQSATSHSLTVRRPLRIRHLDARRYSIDGTPTDCVVVAYSKVMREQKPDLVLSGVNQGGNLGEDVTYSGTVAAAMEAALLGIPAVALSQVRSGDHDYRWETAERHGPEVLRRLAKAGWARDMLVNINFPDLPPDEVRGVNVCRQGRRDISTDVVEGVDPGGRPYVWIGDFASDETLEEDTDLAAIMRGEVAVTPLHLDLTYGSRLAALEAAFR